MDNIKQVLKKTFIYSLAKVFHNNVHNFFLNFRLFNFLANRSKNNKKRILLMLTPEYNNLGDHLIAFAEKKFFFDNFSGYSIDEIPLDNMNIKSGNILSKYSKNYDFVVITGGGFLGSLYLRCEEFFKVILKSFPDNKIIVFPQTIFFSDDEFGKTELEKSKIAYKSHKNLSLFVRDKTFDIVRSIASENQSVGNIPDIALYLNFSDVVQGERKNILVCLRSDFESALDISERKVVFSVLERTGMAVFKTDTVGTGRIPIKRRNAVLLEKISEFQSTKLVVTDRLHGMIFAVITGTPCIALDNTSGKVKGTYDLWLKNIPYVVFANDVSEVASLVPKMINLAEQRYEPEKFAFQWDLLKEAFNV